jgi:endonuclease/exonuclease/phosphatase family metal-dependent hydrolase
LSRHVARRPWYDGAYVRLACAVALVGALLATSLLWPDAPAAEPRVVSGDATAETPRVLKPPVPGSTIEPDPKASVDKGLLKATQRQIKQNSVVTTTFRVSSFNVLGASHTSNGGRHARFASGQVRMSWAIGLLNGTGIDVAGLQEFQPIQHGVFASQAPYWGVYPNASMGREAGANAIVWREDTWELVESHLIDIPYFGGSLRPMPYVLLRHRETGADIWFANFHNPADAHGPAAQHRAAATARQIALANDLTADGTPLIFTGDFNDREEYFCPLTTNTTMAAANGGSTGTSCAPPAKMDVDWIFGSDVIDFGAFASVKEGLVARTSDHPFVWAEATATTRAPSVEQTTRDKNG